MQNSTRLTLAALLALALVPSLAAAQGERPAKPETEPAAAQSAPKSAKPQPQPFVLTLALKESAAGKVVLEKNYTLTCVADGPYDTGSLRDGDRIPYMGEKGREFYDVGTNVDVSRATLQEDAVTFNLRVNSNSLVTKTDGVNLPEVTQWSISVVVSLIPGRSAVVYSATDALGGHKVEIQATVQLVNAR